MLWPTKDGFPATQQPYPQGYYGFLPSTLDFIEGVFHDGYQPAKPGVAAASGVSNATLPPAWVRREIFRADVEVTVKAYKGAAGGSASDTTLLQHGVIARASGGSSAGSKPLVRYVDGSCYLMVRESVGGGNYRFRLWRYNDGAGTVLSTTSSLPYQPGTHRNPHEIRLRVTTLADGNVQLRGYWKTYFDKQFLQVFNAIDSTPQRLLGVGRCGFTLDQEYLAGSNETISVASEFSVTDSDSFLTDSAGALAWQDDFTRSDRDVGQAWTDKWGTLGRNYLADYSSDGAGFAGYLLRQRNLIDGGIRFATMADYRSHSASLDGVDDYLELEVPALALRDPGNGFARFTIAVWVRLDDNRGGNELYMMDVQDGTKPKRLLYWGLRPAAQIGGQEAATFEIRVRQAAGSDTLVTYTSVPFVVVDYIGHTYCYALTYKEEADPINGDSRVRFYIGRGAQALLIDELTISPAHNFKLAQSSADHRIGWRHGFTGSAFDTFLAGDVARVAIYYAYHTGAAMDRVMDAYQIESQYALGDPLDPMHWENAWNFEKFAEAGGITYYRDEVANTNNTSFRDTVGSSTRVVGVLPQLPPVRLEAFWARPYVGTEGQSRKFLVTLDGVFDRVGMVARVRFTGDDGIYDGYRIEVGEGIPAAVMVYRVAGGVYTLLGRQPAATGTRNVAVGVEFELGVEVFSFYPDRVNGPAGIIVEIDGLQVPLISQHPKVSVDLSGALVDHSVEHIWGDVIVFGLCAAPVNNNIDADEWDAKAPAAEGVDVDGIANLTIPAESDGAVGSLNDAIIGVDWRVALSRTVPLSSMEAADGGQKIALLDALDREVYEFRSVHSTRAEINKLSAFFRAHGTVIPFDADPGKWIRGHAAGTFAFVGSSFSTEWTRGGWLATFSIKRLR